MKILVISDMHQRVPAVQTILDNQADKVDKIIFMGDYIDNFPGTLNLYGVDNTCKWLIEKYEEFGDKAIWLCGNHDFQYIEEAYRVGHAHSMHHPSKRYACSGYTTSKANKIRKYFGREKSDFLKQLKLTVTLEGFTFSHGGFSPFHFKPELTSAENVERWVDVYDYAIKTISSPEPSEIYIVGQCRGGRFGVGGPLWLDFKQEFTPIEDLPQVMGHTPHTYPARNGNSACLDCFNEYYGIVENGHIDFYYPNGELFDESAQD